MDMKGICKDCGCEFDIEIFENTAICPDCAAFYNQQMENFLQEYNENLDKYRVLDQEFLQNMVWDEYGSRI